MNQLTIRIREKKFGDRVILSGVDLRVADGEFVAIVGPSGTGKTTLLSMVAGLDTDFDGSIGYGGQALSGPDGPPAGLGMVFQQPRLMPWLTALDNVRLAEAERRARDAGYASRAGHLLDEVGLAPFSHAWPGQLSGGMQRRVALARAFVVEPWLLLMDEPFISLDLPTANQLRALLQRLCARTRPLVLFVTHDLNEALAMADRILFLGDTPTRVVLDHRVGARGQAGALDGPGVLALRQQLLERYPELLSGIAAVSGPAAARA